MLFLIYKYNKDDPKVKDGELIILRTMYMFRKTGMEGQGQDGLPIVFLPKKQF